MEGLALRPTQAASLTLLQKIFAVTPMGGWGWEKSPDALIVLLCALFLAALVALVKYLGPKFTLAYMWVYNARCSTDGTVVSVPQPKASPN